MSQATNAAEAYDQTSGLVIQQVVQRLNSHLGPTVVAALSGSRDSKAPYGWAQSTGRSPSTDAVERIRTAHRVWKVIADAESDQIARTWFLGQNHFLGETSPIVALREGRHKDVVDAATAFVTGTWSE